MKHAYHVKSEYLPGAIEKVNELHQWINDNFKEIKRLTDNARYIQNGMALSKKDKEAVSHILKGSPFRAYIEITEYSVILNTDITYKTGESGCHYYKQYIYLKDNDTFKPLPIYNIDAVNTLFSVFNTAKKELESAEDNYTKAVRNLSPFQTM